MLPPSSAHIPRRQSALSREEGLRAKMTLSWWRRTGYAAVPRSAPPPLVYDVDARALEEGAARLRGVYCPLVRDEETDLFLDACFNPSAWQTLAMGVLRPALSRCMSHTGVNALLGTGSMFVLSRVHMQTLLEFARGLPPSVDPEMRAAGGRLLDVGAGDGGVTERVAPLFDEVHATEVCPRMVREVRRRGIRCHEVGDLDSLPGEVRGDGFDVVACLNVIDRCDRPRTLLRQLHALLRPGGRLVLATPLPFNAWVERGRHWVRPAEHIEVDAGMLDPAARQRYGLGFEQAARLLAVREFEAAGFAVEAVSRVPYLSAGDVGVPYYVLDDAVFVMRRAEYPK